MAKNQHNLLLLESWTSGEVSRRWWWGWWVMKMMMIQYLWANTILNADKTNHLVALQNSYWRINSHRYSTWPSSAHAAMQLRSDCLITISIPYHVPGSTNSQPYRTIPYNSQSFQNIYFGLFAIGQDSPSAFVSVWHRPYGMYSGKAWCSQTVL